MSRGRTAVATVGELADALETAVDAVGDHLDDPALDRARGVLDRAGTRLRLAPDRTVVAVAGPTGAGKSTTVNALVGQDIAEVGVRRPTTSRPVVAVWPQGDDDHDVGPLLDWLDVPRRHRVEGEGDLRDLGGLVLIDLPDFDSTETDHHREVDRLGELVDAWLWVIDPQKYADAALHDRYLRPLAHQAAATVVVLNRVDQLPADQRRGVVADLRRLLDADGMHGVPVLEVSARTGEGLGELREELARRVRAGEAARGRAAAELRAAAGGVRHVVGERPAGTPEPRHRAALTEAVRDVAGVPVVEQAVRRAALARGRAATGWPLTSWVGRLRPDPLRRLHLDRLPSVGRGRDEGSDGASAPARTSLPPVTTAQLARVDGATRTVIDDVADPLPDPWRAALRRASTSRRDDLGDALDRAVGSVDLGPSGAPAWARGIQILQWVLIVVALVGAVWLGALALLDYLRLDLDVLLRLDDSPQPVGVPLPTLLLLGGLAAGLLLALLTRPLVRLTASRRVRRAHRRLTRAVDPVGETLLLEPVTAVVAAHTRAREALARAG